jgi:hypothetical protein
MARRGRPPAAAKDPNAPKTEKDMLASELYPKVNEQVTAILAQLKDLCISDQRQDPNWEPNPDDPEEQPRMIDTDPPTDPLGICRNSASVLAIKSVGDAKKYTGRKVKTTGVHSVKAVIVKARSDLAKAYKHLLEGQQMLQLEEQAATQERRTYQERNRQKELDKAKREKSRGTAMIREAERTEQELAS